MSERGGILGRYARVLEAVAMAPNGRSLTEIGRATGLARGTVHRLIAALLEVGYLAPRDGRKVYVLGPRLLRLTHLAAAPAAVATLVRPLLDDLVARFGETVFLARLAGTSVTSIATALPDQEGQSFVQPGRSMPVHAAASAKAIVAFQEPAVIDACLALPRQRFTEHTRTSEAEVRSDLTRVRRQGYAVCADELDPGVLSYAVPVRFDGAGVLYSVGIVGLSSRLGQHPRDVVIAALRAASEQIATRLQTGLQEPAVVAPPAPDRWSVA